MKKFIFVLMFFILYLGYSFSYNFNWQLEGVRIIPRTKWLGEENLKYLFKDYKAYQNIIKYNEELNEKIKKNPSKYKKLFEKRVIEKERKKYMLKNWKNDIKADKVIKELNGKELWWPISYKKNKTKIIIHHTDSLYSKNKTQADVEKFLRGIYYYHAIKRGWGDIGYNFIIDHFGNIYEGRIGGDDVIGANAKRNNVTSIGIALIGNFNIEKPTKEQIKSLIKLSTALARKYNIEPYKKQVYHKSYWKYPYMQDVWNYSIVGHKDAGHTACPGKYLYEILPYVRQEVYKNLKSIVLSNYKISTKRQEKTINLGYKFSLNDTINLIIPGANFESCSSFSNSFEILYCKKNKITLKYDGYEKIGTKTIIAKGEKFDYKIKFKPIWIQDLRYLMKEKASKYLGKNINHHKIKKVKYKVYKYELNKIIKKPVYVLLYELSNFSYFNISCDNICAIKTDKKTYYVPSLKIDKIDPLIIWINGNPISSKYVNIRDSKGGLIYFNNYKRRSYAGIPWNNFHGEIIIKKDYIKPIGKKIQYKYVVINKVSFNNYLNGIAETNDQMPFEKIKVMALLVKDYLLFYANKKNIHPSIPAKASYNAIDDPRIFQKYVGAGFEKTSKFWAKALKSVDGEFIFYQNYIPILPYFSCSIGFTFSAKQKFGRIDTPYLTNNIDLGKCEKFYGHGVGLSGKGAEFLAKKGLNYKQIIKWYFPGTEIEKIR